MKLQESSAPKTLPLPCTQDFPLALLQQSCDTQTTGRGDADVVKQPAPALHSWQHPQPPSPAFSLIVEAAVPLALARGRIPCGVSSVHPQRGVH